MKIKAFAILDTNVLVSGSLTHGPSGEVLDLVSDNNIIPIFDERMLYEYYTVLNRKEKFDISQQTIYNVLFQVVNNGVFINDVEKAKIDFKDRKDIPFFEVKESAKEFSPHLVTVNIKDFPPSPTTVKPEVMLGVMNQLDWYTTMGLNSDVDYEKIVNDYKNQQLATSKYKSGKELIDDIFDAKERKIRISSRVLQIGETAFNETAKPSTPNPTSPYDN